MSLIRQAFLLVLSLAFTHALATETHVIYPAGVFPDDINAIQQVIDDASVRGVDAKIVLKARNIDGIPTAFNFGTGDVFGPPSSGGTRYGLRIFGGAGALHIVGESKKGAHTTIEGGLRAIEYDREQFLAVKGIRFVNPILAVLVSGTKSALIKDNVVLDVQLGSTIAVSDFFDTDRISGKVRIVGNLIQGRAQDSRGWAISITGGNSTSTFWDVEIVDNKVFDNRSDAIVVQAFRGHVLIKDNLLDPGPGEPFVSTFRYGTPIHIFTCTGPATYEVVDNDIYAADLALAGIRFLVQPCFDEHNVPVEGAIIKDNRIVAGDTNGLEIVAPDGIFVRNTIKDNEIEVAAQDWGYAGIEMYTATAKGDLGGRIDDNVFKDNEIRGYAPYGIGLQDFSFFSGGTGGLTGNTISDNDFEDFTPLGDPFFDVAPADIWFNYSSGPYACNNFVFDQEDALILDPEQCNFIESDDDDDDDDDDD